MHLYNFSQNCVPSSLERIVKLYQVYHVSCALRYLEEKAE